MSTTSSLLLNVLCAFVKDKYFMSVVDTLSKEKLAKYVVEQIVARIVLVVRDMVVQVITNKASN